MAFRNSFGHAFGLDTTGVVTPFKRVDLFAGGRTSIDENWLQEFIDRNPACLPLAEIEPGLGTFRSVCREMPTKVGPIDNLLMSAAGDIAIVETKLWRNHQARRDVLAQVLDYAVSVFGSGYEGFEKMVKRGKFANGSPPQSLYALFSDDAEAETEPVFIDSVSRNLAHGRALIVNVGDGVKSETERLLDGLKNYAQFNFTLALVELCIFRNELTEERIVVPRTIAKTQIVNRHVFELRSMTPNAAPILVESEEIITPETLSSESFWTEIERSTPGARAALEQLIENVSIHGIVAEFKSSLNFKWSPAIPTNPAENPVNFGYVQRNGMIVLTAASWWAPKPLAEQYVKNLAAAFGCDAQRWGGGGDWTLYTDSKPLRLSAVLNRLDLWADAMRTFQKAITSHQETGTPA
jgi:hypothetical protein